MDDPRVQPMAAAMIEGGLCRGNDAEAEARDFARSLIDLADAYDPLRYPCDEPGCLTISDQQGRVWVRFSPDHPMSLAMAVPPRPLARKVHPPTK